MFSSIVDFCEKIAEGRTEKKIIFKFILTWSGSLPSCVNASLEWIISSEFDWFVFYSFKNKFKKFISSQVNFCFTLILKSSLFPSLFVLGAWVIGTKRLVDDEVVILLVLFVILLLIIPIFISVVVSIGSQMLCEI